MKRIGLRIKAKRESLGMQVKDLSAEIGVSPSMISQIEKAKAYPSLITLQKIAIALSTTISELLGENESKPARPTMRVNERKFVRQNESGTKLYLLSNHDHSKQMEPYYIHFEKGSDSAEIMTSNYPCQEFCFVISGSFEIVAGKRKYHLNKGDSFYFNSTQTHLFKNTGDDPAQLIWVVKLK